MPENADVIRPDMPPLTWAARRFLLALALGFLAAVAFDLNGSSTACWQRSFPGDLRVTDAPTGVLAGVPKRIRGDEWFVWTPAFLSQARQPQPFPVSNPSLGPGVTPLLMSLPARHYTMLFRPQLWGFFVAPFDYAFSWYWNAKVFGLCAAMFLLCWTLTDGRFGLSIFGALAVQFSGFVQWWFSTPAMLPEMLASWAVAVLAALTFFQGRRRPAQAGAALVFVWATANFVLCCYPAFLIPLLHLGICLVVGYLWQQRRFSLRGTLWLAGALLLVALVLTPWALECLPTLRIEAQTIYPGQRRTDGGDLPWYRYLSGLFTLGMDENRRLLGLNVCEAANFYPLWLVPLGLGAWTGLRRVAGRREGFKTSLANHGMEVMLAAYLAVLTLYCLVPLPAWFCDLTLLSRETGRRSLLGLGVGGTLLLVLALAARPARGWRLTPPVGLATLGWSLGVAGFLYGYHAALLKSLPASALWVSAGSALVAVLAYFFGPRWLLPTLWLAAAVGKLALVNPVCVGLPELWDSPMVRSLAATVRAEPSARWAVYGSAVGAELIKTTGARLINGTHVIPDPDLIHRLDPDGQNFDRYNRYGNLEFSDAPYQAGVPVTLVGVDYCRAEIGPRRLRELFPEVRYLVATHAMPSCREAGFELVGALPANHLFLYRLPTPPP